MDNIYPDRGYSPFYPPTCLAVGVDWNCAPKNSHKLAPIFSSKIPENLEDL